MQENIFNYYQISNEIQHKLDNQIFDWIKFTYSHKFKIMKIKNKHKWKK